MILPPGRGTKRIAYRRVTTFVGALDDTYGLMQWKTRQVALGMGQRKDLVLAAAAAEADDKRKLNDIAEKACEHALSSAAATTGTALHALTERIDRGKPLGVVPDEFRGDINAYQKATADIEFSAIETFRVHDDWKIAGTADRIGRDRRGRLKVYDVKTGSVDYPHKMAMQLAMYARSLPYDIATDTRGTFEDDLDLGTGIIIHLPAGQSRCDLYEIDIAKGWGACLIAKQVWDWRATKNLTHRVGDDRENVWEKSNAPRPALIDAASTAATLDVLRALWNDARQAGALTDDFRAAARKRGEELAAESRRASRRKTDATVE